MRKRLIVLLFIAVIVSVASVAICDYEKSKTEKKESKENLYNQVELFADAISLIKSEYVDDVDSKKLIYGAMKGLLGSLDDFSQFMEPDEYNEIKLETKGEFGGIGIEISTKDGILTVIAPMAGTPAESAGLMAQDRIVKIDGVITKNLALDEAVKSMRGKPGTLVTLTIWREKDDKIFDVSIKRDVIKIHSIKKAAMLEDKIGYIRLAEFQENTPKDLEEALKKLQSEGMDSLILDLRNNPGGLLEVAIDVSEQFLPKDELIVSIKAKDPAQNTAFKSKGRFNYPDYPLAVLVNEGSASASEIVAGAIQDNKRGIIIGKKTFGKASVQTVVPLKDGSALRITTASYFTPSGKMIRNQGIIPDIVVEREELPLKKADKTNIFERLEEAKRPSPQAPAKTEEKIERDNQLERAIDAIKALKVYRSGKV